MSGAGGVLQTVVAARVSSPSATARKVLIPFRGWIQLQACLLSPKANAAPSGKGRRSITSGLAGSQHNSTGKVELFGCLIGATEYYVPLLPLGCATRKPCVPTPFLNCAFVGLRKCGFARRLPQDLGLVLPSLQREPNPPEAA